MPHAGHGNAEGHNYDDEEDRDDAASDIRDSLLGALEKIGVRLKSAGGLGGYLINEALQDGQEGDD